MSIPFSSEQFEKKPTRTMPRVRVRLDKVVATQRGWDQKKVDDIARKGPYEKGTDPIAGVINGKYHILDGHHRVAGAIQRGDTHITLKRVK
jgi:ParB-like chromosome segregation protein Spo0J